MKIDRDHLANLLEWSFDEIFAACGDGGANWVVKRYNINDIHLFIRIYLEEKRKASHDRTYKTRMTAAPARYKEWEVSDVEEGSQKVGDTFTVSSPPEQCLLVTTDIKNVPPWNECVVML